MAIKLGLISSRFPGASLDPPKKEFEVGLIYWKAAGKQAYHEVHSNSPFHSNKCLVAKNWHLEYTNMKICIT